MNALIWYKNINGIIGNKCVTQTTLRQHLIPFVHCSSGRKQFSFHHSQTSPPHNVSSVNKQLLVPSNISFSSNHESSNTFRKIAITNFNFIRIVNFFSTKSSSSSTNEVTNPNSTPQNWRDVQKSLWKSSSKIDPRKEKLNREEFYRRIMLERDFSEAVKEEMLIYELGDKTFRYKLLFGLLILQFFFWSVCANFLYIFYKGVDSKGNHIKKLKEEDSLIKIWMISFRGELFI